MQSRVRCLSIDVHYIGYRSHSGAAEGGTRNPGGRHAAAEAFWIPGSVLFLLRQKRRSRSESLPDFGEGGRAKARSGGAFGRRLLEESKDPTPALPENGEGE